MRKEIHGIRKWRLLVLITVIILVADQLTKQLVIEFVPFHNGFEIIHGYLDIVHVKNAGIAFGMMAEAASGFQRVFFILLSLAAMAGIAWIINSSAETDRLLLVGYSLFFAGALGNLVDRVRFGEVVDFLDIHWGNLHWPAFNVADSALCVGAGLFLIHVLFKK